VITGRVHPGETNSSWVMKVRSLSLCHNASSQSLLLRELLALLTAVRPAPHTTNLLAAPVVTMT
jgi:hypothetical protein